MPGLVAFGRRWRVGGDDLVVPALVLVLFDAVWAMAAVVALPAMSAMEQRHGGAVEADVRAVRVLLTLVAAVLVVAVVLEAVMAYVSTRGTIMHTAPRASIVHLVHLRTALLLVQLMLAAAGIVWLSFAHGHLQQLGAAATILIGVTAWNVIVVLLTSLIAWCSYDTTGARWIALQRYERKMQAGRHHLTKCSDSSRHWRKRHFQTAYQDDWAKRCRCCCLPKSQNERGSLAEVARLLADFFHDHDLVPSDIVAGLVLLRRRQKQLRNRLLEKRDNDTYEYLSGAAITSTTQFLDLRKPETLKLLTSIRYYMQYALGAYGWVFYLNENRQGRLCRLLRHVKCCSCCCLCLRARIEEPLSEVVEDDCCFGHSTALSLTLPSDIAVVYANFHCGIGETPFYVALDRQQNSVVVCVRGTLSLKDLLTDLCASPEDIPLEECEYLDSVGGPTGFQAHQGVVICAKYVVSFLINRGVLKAAFEKLPGANLVLVGHSLGGAIVTVMGLILRRQGLYRQLRCFVYSPPGGLLTRRAAEESKEFCTAVMVGKDCVPRMGLEQMARLRSDLIFLLEASQDTKWKIISQSLPFRCCQTATLTIDRQMAMANLSAVPPDGDSINQQKSIDVEKGHRRHESSPAVLIPAISQRLYPCGALLHVVRTWKDGRHSSDCRPGYAAIWTNEEGLREVLISPVMVSDHMPAGVIDALDHLLEACIDAQTDSNGNDASVPPIFTKEFYHQRSLRRKRLIESARQSSPVHGLNATRRSASSPALEFSENGVIKFENHVKKNSVKRKISRPKIEVPNGDGQPGRRSVSNVTFKCGSNEVINAAPAIADSLPTNEPVESLSIKESDDGDRLSPSERRSLPSSVVNRRENERRLSSNEDIRLIDDEHL